MNGYSYSNIGFILIPNQLPFLGLAASWAMLIKQLVTTSSGFENVFEGVFDISSSL